VSRSEPRHPPAGGARCAHSGRTNDRLAPPRRAPDADRFAPGPAGNAESQTITTIEQDLGLKESLETDVPWLVVVWNDPVNLMTYVTYVLRKLFGYSSEKATKLMLDVHNKGRAVVASGPRERAENDVSRLHRHGLWATLEKSG
jgi:ATP-dependent Clp protease adaptor protein ClpS